jgi:hypothetical protein
MADTSSTVLPVSLESIADGIKETQTSIQIILGLVQSIDSRLTALEGKNAERQDNVVIEQANTISNLSSRVTLLRERLATAEEAAAAGGKAGSRKRRAREVVNNLDGDDEPSSSRPRLSNAATAVFAAGSPEAIRQLLADNTGAPVEKKKSSDDKGKTVAECLITISKAGHVTQANLKNAKLTPRLGEDPSTRPRVRNVLELVNFVMTQEERNVLMNPENDAQLAQAAMELEKRAMGKMASLEGRDPDQQPNGKRQRPFIIGLGTRVRKYKKMMFESGNYVAKDPNALSRTLELKEREEVIADAQREGRLHLIQAPRGNKAAAVAAQAPAAPSQNDQVAPADLADGVGEGSAEGERTFTTPPQSDVDV